MTRRNNWPRLLLIFLVLLFVSEAVSTARCDSGQPPFKYADFKPSRTFTCCTPDKCASAVQFAPEPCCQFLVGSTPNSPDECNTLGELFTNDWGMNPDLPCIAGWYGYSDGNNWIDIDYDNDWGTEESRSDLNLAIVSKYGNMITTDSSYAAGGHASDWNSEVAPRGWVGAAVGIPTDLCSFHGIECNSAGRVILLCVGT